MSQKAMRKIELEWKTQALLVEKQFGLVQR